jgi:LmbE family N-acetylglucosaminyl deacetylase
MLNILFLVAHADDEALGPGGLIKKLCTNKANLKLVVMSDGKITVRNKFVDNSKHLINSAKILGIKDITLLGYKDQIFETYPISKIANSLLKKGFNPDLIVTHSSSELNRDHRITLEVAKIIARPHKKKCSIISFDIPNNSFNYNKNFKPNFFVDISKEIKDKISAFKKYKNEIQKYPHPYSVGSLELIAKYYGFLSGYKYAEAYEIVKIYEDHLNFIKKK